MRLALRVVFLSSVLALGVVVMITTRGSEEANAAVHGTVVPEGPRSNTPVVLDGTVWSTIQIGDRVIVGGSFTQVEREDGVVMDQPYLFAYDINTGEYIDSFNPVLDGEVRTLEQNDEGDAFFAGGRFKQVDGQWATRIAAMDYFGERIPSFTASADALVMTIATHDGVVWLGGNFNNVNGEEHRRIAAVDATDGELVASFEAQAIGAVGKAGSSSVRALEVHPTDDVLLVVHGAERIGSPNDDVPNLGIAMIDLTNNQVTDWYTDWYAQTYHQCSAGAVQLRDGAFSPDGSFFAAVTKGNWKCDDIIAFSTVDDRDGNDPKWVTKAHDSVFSIGITDQAVYIGGHFCFIKDWGPMTVEEAVADPWHNKPSACLSDGDNVDIGDVEARYQLAALDPHTGEALAWEPIVNAQEAVFDIEPVERGLLIGMDRDWTNGVQTGRHAFFDFGGNTPPFQPPEAPEPTCAARVTVERAVELRWDAVGEVSEWSVRRNGSWIATTSTTSLLDNTPDAGDHTYVIRYRHNGIRNEVACTPTPVTIPAENGPTCVSTDNADGSVRLDWTDMGATTYQIRVDGSWLASSTTTSFIDADAPANASHKIRFRSDGQNQELACN